MLYQDDFLKTFFHSAKAHQEEVMKKYALIISMVLLSTSAATQAKELNWGGVSTLTMVSGGVPVVEDKLKISFILTGLWFSQSDSLIVFGDLGVTWKINNFFWIQPMVGGAGNWAGTDAFTASLLAGTAFNDGLFTSFHMIVFLVMEEGVLDIYSFNSLDFNPLSWLNIGGHSESANELAWFGPHIGLTAGSFHGEIRWQAGGDFKSPTLGHEVRFVTSFAF